MKKRLISLLLVFVCMFTFVMVPVNVQGKTTTQKYKENQSKINKQKSNLKSSSSEASDLQDDIDYYNKKIKSIESKLKKQTKERDKVAKKLSAAKKELKEAKEKKKKYDSLMKKRLQVMYMYEDVGYLEVLFSAKDFSDFLTKIQTVKDLVAYDQDILTDLKKAENKIAVKTKEIADEKTKLDKIVAKLNKNKENAATYKAAKKAELTNTTKDIKSIKAQIAMLNKEQAQLRSKMYTKTIAKSYSTKSKVSGKGSAALVSVAKSQLGNYNGYKFWHWYGFSCRVSWCACFVSWCANQCGYIGKAIIPKFSYVDNGASYFKRIGRWKGRYTTPKAGYIIFFDWDGNGVGNHVGIVEYCSGGTVHTIEGNSSNAVRRRSYSVGSWCIMGYGAPNY